MSDSKVLQTIGDFQVTEADVDRYIERMPQEQRIYASQPGFRKQVLERLVDGHLLMLKGKEDHLDETEIFRDSMEKAKEEILAQLAIQQAVKDIAVADADVKKFYEENKVEFEDKETVAARHILVNSEEECQAILEKIRKGEKTFEEAAKESSTCPSSQKGGDLGTFGHGQMVKEFDEAAFAAEVDAVVGPVKTQFGYHLIQVYEKKVMPGKSFEEVAPLLKQNLIVQQQNQAYTALITSLREKYMK